MPFNLVPSPKSLLGLATGIKSLLLVYVTGHSEEKNETQLDEVPQNKDTHTFYGIYLFSACTAVILKLWYIVAL